MDWLKELLKKAGIEEAKQDGLIADIYFEEHEKALEFGVRKVRVREVLGGGR